MSRCSGRRRRTEPPRRHNDRKHHRWRAVFGWSWWRRSRPRTRFRWGTCDRRRRRCTCRRCRRSTIPDWCTRRVDQVGQLEPACTFRAEHRLCMCGRVPRTRHRSRRRRRNCRCRSLRRQCSFGPGPSCRSSYWPHRRCAGARSRRWLRSRPCTRRSCTHKARTRAVRPAGRPRGRRTCRRIRGSWPPCSWASGRRRLPGSGRRRHYRRRPPWFRRSPRRYPCRLCSDP